MRATLVLVFAACAGSESASTSSLAACELDEMQACSAPVEVVAAGAALAAGVSYEIAGVGDLSFTPAISGTYTIYFDHDPHVCDFNIVPPSCASPVACPQFTEARQYPMAAGEDYEIRVPDGAHVRIEAPTPTGPGPTVTWTSGPTEGGTSGPVVNITFEVTGAVGDLDCRLDGVPGPCPSMGLSTPWDRSLFITKAGPHTYAVRAVDAAGNVSVTTRAWTTICEPPSATGALALLHLDETAGQTLANPLGPAAIRGDTTGSEASDPTLGAAGRFGRAVSFAAGDHLAWPLALGAPPSWSVELWARPQVPAVSTTQDLLATGDGSLIFRTLNDSGNARFAVVVNGVETRVSGFDASNRWHKLLASYDGEALRIWADGGMYYVPGTWPVTLDALQIGGDYAGSIDEIWISDQPIVELPSGWDRYCPI